MRTREARGNSGFFVAAADHPTTRNRAMAVKSAPSTANSASNGTQGQFPYYAEVITPSDVDTWAQPVMVYVGGSGDVRVMPWGAQSAVTFAGVSGGSMLPV